MTGPYETLQRVPSIDVVFVGHRRGEVRSDNGMLGLMCDAAFDEVTELNREAALASQLMIEYDPVPPFDSGHLAKASAATLEPALEFYEHRE